MWYTGLSHWLECWFESHLPCTSHPTSYLMYLEAANNDLSTWIPATHMGDPYIFLGSWLQPGLDCCRHLGSKPAEGRYFSVSLFFLLFSLSHSAFQIFFFKLCFISAKYSKIFHQSCLGVNALCFAWRIKAGFQEGTTFCCIRKGALCGGAVSVREWRACSLHP